MNIQLNRPWCSCLNSLLVAPSLLDVPCEGEQEIPFCHNEKRPTTGIAHCSDLFAIVMGDSVSQGSSGVDFCWVADHLDLKILNIGDELRIT